MANLVYDIKDKPKVSQLIVLALQQLLAILAATIAVPTIIGLPTQIPAAISGNRRNVPCRKNNRRSDRSW